MKLLSAVLLTLLTTAYALPQPDSSPNSPTLTTRIRKPDLRPCGFKIAPCPSTTYCKPRDPSCPALRGENCAGDCVPLPTPTYQSCGGFRISQVPCPKDQICIDDPYVGGCGMACDAPGICVTPEFCGGFAGFACKGGKMCVDDPRDDCDPENGGADCGGLCV